MLTRRRLLGTVSGAGAIVLAGCSGGNSSSDSNEQRQSNESTPSEDRDEPDGLTNFSVESITFSYGFSAGLKPTVVLRNQTDVGSGINAANVSVEAYDGESRLGETSQWQDIQAGTTGEFELRIESLAGLADNSLEDVTEVRVRGKETQGEYIELNTFSGDTVRSQVET